MKRASKPAKVQRFKCPECPAYMIPCDVHGTPNPKGQYLVCLVGKREIDRRLKSKHYSRDSRYGMTTHTEYRVQRIEERSTAARRVNKAKREREQTLLLDPSVGRRKDA